MRKNRISKGVCPLGVVIRDTIQERKCCARASEIFKGFISEVDLIMLLSKTGEIGSDLLFSETRRFLTLAPSHFLLLDCV